MSIIQNQSAEFNDDEMMVAEILLELPTLILKHDSSLRFPFTWGAKRRRSAIDSTPSPPRPRSTPPPQPLPPSSLIQTCAGVDDDRLIKKEEATSPSTPLSFSPSESDDKSKHSSRKISKKRLIFRREKVEPCLEMNRSSMNIAMESSAQPTVVKSCVAINVENPDHHHHQPSTLVYQQGLIVDQTAAIKSEISEGRQYPSGQLTLMWSSSKGLGLVNHMGPTGIHDLNVSVEGGSGVDSLQPLDLRRAVNYTANWNKAMAAEARKKRMQIYKVKNSIVAKKPRYEHR